jgi:hypothetical protein
MLTNLNPLNLLDSLLSDYVPPKYRRLIHALVLLVAAGITIWEASDHDWRKAAIAAAAALYAAANKANTDPDANPASAPEPEVSGVVSGNPDLGPDEPVQDESALYGDGAERGV